MIGHDSGVFGDITLPFVQGVRAWLSDVNARGGLNGHPVRIVAADDGGDPGKALALARRMVDQDRVVAFFGEHAPATAQALVPFLEERKIPSIGSLGSNPVVANSPMSFDVGPGGDKGVSWEHIGPLLALSDKRKVSILYCREGASCRSIRDNLHRWAKDIGIEIVHEAQVTLTQPDYTAEVLSARNAGAEAIVNAYDNATVIRVARSAHRQGYYPILVGNYGLHEVRMLERGGADVEGMLIGSSGPHWDSPKLADYRSALSRHVPGAKPSAMSILAWGGGKLLDSISKHFLDQVTTADMLNALYSVNGETLGGLFPPLTYLPGQPYEGTNFCHYPIKVEQGKFIMPKGDNYYLCAPGWTPRKK